MDKYEESDIQGKSTVSYVGPPPPTAQNPFHMETSIKMLEDTRKRRIFIIIA